jgi:hypothetical protein
MKTIACLVFAVAACASQAAYACKPVHGHDYAKPDDKGKIDRAGAVFSGSIVKIRKVPHVDARFPRPEAWLYTFEVARWEKGGQAALVDVADDFGTNCDSLFSITHIRIAADAALPSSAWRIFARESNGRLQVINAEPLK